MEGETMFRCMRCGEKKSAKEAPMCCGSKMELILDACTQANGPEHSRPMEDEGPCDDSRGG